MSHNGGTYTAVTSRQWVGVRLAFYSAALMWTATLGALTTLHASTTSPVPLLLWVNILALANVWSNPICTPSDAIRTAQAPGRVRVRLTPQGLEATRNLTRQLHARGRVGLFRRSVYVRLGLGFVGSVLILVAVMLASDITTSGITSSGWLPVVCLVGSLIALVGLLLAVPFGRREYVVIDVGGNVRGADEPTVPPSSSPQLQASAITNISGEDVEQVEASAPHVREVRGGRGDAEATATWHQMSAAATGAPMVRSPSASGTSTFQSNTAAFVTSTPASAVTPVAAAHHGGRRGWSVPLIVAAVSLIAGLVIWAPWSNKGPAAPASVRAMSSTATSVRFQWAPSTDIPNVTEYLIQRNGVQVGTVAGTVTSYLSKGLAPDTTYRYRVFAVSGTTRSDPSAELVIRTLPPSPVGLKVDRSTVSSVAFHWSRPATGPAPDRYVILRGGAVVGSVSGTVTSYRNTGLAPATKYRYAVTAQWGSRRSAPTTALVVKTVTPPVSAARLQGSWDVTTKIVKVGFMQGKKVGELETYTWEFKPKCTSGPCALVVSGAAGGWHDFKATLARAGAVYTGTTRAHITHCSSKDVVNTVTLRITVKTAGVNGRAWNARSWVGSMVLFSPYTSAGGGWFCPSGSSTFSLAASG